MKKALAVILILMVILTVIYVSAVVYVNMNANSNNGVEPADGKLPTEYGLLRYYFAEKLETEPQEWNTTEELGIIFERMKSEKEAYALLIVDPEKALPWMKDTILVPDAIKYEDNFYSIGFLHVFPGFPETGILHQFKVLRIPLGVALGAGWVFTGVLFLKGRKKEHNIN